MAADLVHRHTREFHAYSALEVDNSKWIAMPMVDMENIALHLEPLSFILLRKEVRSNSVRDRYKNMILHNNGAGHHRPTTRLIADKIACLEIIVQAKLF